MLYVVEKIRTVPETNSSSAHIFEYDNWPEEDYTGEKIIEELNKLFDVTGNVILPHPKGETDFIKSCTIWTDWKDKYNFIIMGLLPFLSTTYNEDRFKEFKRALEKITGRTLNYPTVDVYFNHAKMFNAEVYDYGDKVLVNSWETFYTCPDVLIHFLEHSKLILKGFDGDPCPGYVGVKK